MQNQCGVFFNIQASFKVIIIYFLIGSLWAKLGIIQMNIFFLSFFQACLLILWAFIVLSNVKCTKEMCILLLKIPE